MGDQQWNVFTQDLLGGPAKLIGPPVSARGIGHYEAHFASPDGKWLLVHDLSGQCALYPIAGGDIKTIPGCNADDIWIRWSADGRSGFIYHDEKTSAPVFRIDVVSGKRDHLFTVAPGDSTGVTSIHRIRMAADGKTYAYTYLRELSDLFLVEGVK